MTMFQKILAGLLVLALAGFALLHTGLARWAFYRSSPRLHMAGNSMLSLHTTEALNSPVLVRDIELRFSDQFAVDIEEVRANGRRKLNARPGRNDGSLPVLTYHATDQRPAAISTTPTLFRRQLEKLAGRGLTGMSLARTVAERERTGGFPPHSVALTFDDGYLRVFTEALPSLTAHGFTATVFLASGLVGLAADAARRQGLGALNVNPDSPLR